MKSWGTQPSFPIRHSLHGQRVEDFPPDTPAYARMAPLWDGYAVCFIPDYASFLAAAEARYGGPVESVLDLACGTGLITRQLAARAERVVGLDASVDMLRQAHARTPGGNVRYLLGDFRDCPPGDTFDAAVCAFDSLNYLERPEELGAVFRSVRRLLRPGGLFVFDVLGEYHFLLRSRVKTEVQLGRQRFEHYRFYDPSARVCEDRLVFADAIEGHRRIAIRPVDVRRAAREEGVAVKEHFGFKLRDFYLIRMP